MGLGPPSSARPSQSNLAGSCSGLRRQPCIRVWRIYCTLYSSTFVRSIPSVAVMQYCNVIVHAASVPFLSGQTPQLDACIDSSSQIFYLFCPALGYPFYERALRIPLQPGPNSITGCGCQGVERNNIEQSLRHPLRPLSHRRRPIKGCVCKTDVIELARERPWVPWMTRSSLAGSWGPKLKRAAALSL